MQLPISHGGYKPSPPLPLPSRFGRYRLTKLLAVGGMSQIYLAKAFGAEGFVKPLVIKRLDPALAHSSHITNLFINEAKLLVALNHGNIVPVFDFGRVGDDLYMAMEYIPGVSLRKLLQALKESGHQLDVQLAAHIVTEICKGLDYAHRKTDASGRPAGIIHRDIKPTNILISNEGEVKIVDFGVAKLADRVESGGQLTGTLAYMSPEQAERQVVDPRTDIFSTGLVLYELLANQRAYEGETALDMLSMARRADIPPLPESVPRELKEVAVRATQRDPSIRFASAHEMEQALSEYLLLARSAGSTVDSLSPSSKLATLMKELPLEPEDAFEDEQELAPEEPEEQGPVQVSGLLEMHQPPDLAVIRDAAETFHSEFLTRVLMEEQDVSRRVPAWIWIAGAAAMVVVVSVALILLLTRPTGPAMVPPVSLSASGTPDAGVEKDASWGIALTISSDAALPEEAGEGAGDEAPGQPRARHTQRGRRARHGFLNLNSIPWSHVTIDGRRMKRPTPLLRVKLRTGKHTIVLENRERKLRKTVQVYIRPGATTWKVVRLR